MCVYHIIMVANLPAFQMQEGTMMFLMIEVE